MTWNYCQGSRKLNRAYKELLGKNKLSDSKGKYNKESICKLIRTVKGNSLRFKPCHHNGQHALFRRQRKALNWSADESQVVLGIWCTIPEIHHIGLQGLLSSFVVRSMGSPERRPRRQRSRSPRERNRARTNHLERRQREREEDKARWAFSLHGHVQFVCGWPWITKSSYREIAPSKCMKGALRSFW